MKTYQFSGEYSAAYIREQGHMCYGVFPGSLSETDSRGIWCSTGLL